MALFCSAIGIEIGIAYHVLVEAARGGRSGVRVYNEGRRLGSARLGSAWLGAKLMSSWRAATFHLPVVFLNFT